MVKAQGSGAGFSMLGLESDGARTRASEAAEAAVRKDGLRSLRLSKCPACRKRQPGALGGALFFLALRCLLFAGVFALVGVILATGKSMPSWLRAIEVVTIGGLVVYELSHIAKAEHRLEFVKKR